MLESTVKIISFTLKCSRKIHFGMMHYKFPEKIDNSDNFHVNKVSCFFWAINFHLISVERKRKCRTGLKVVSDELGIELIDWLTDWLTNCLFEYRPSCDLIFIGIRLCFGIFVYHDNKNHFNWKQFWVMQLRKQNLMLPSKFTFFWWTLSSTTMIDEHHVAL